VIAGEGPARASLERSIRRLGLDGRAQLIGHRSDVSSLLAAADLFVLPSFSEGSPNAMIEAMQAGVPVVASDIEGVRELVENGREAVLVAVNDPNALGQAMTTLLADREGRSRMARQGHERLLGHTPGRTRLLLQLYSSLATTPRVASTQRAAAFG
jgi:glycosyltransferase involved in cell wall biosynthesis